MTFGGQKEEKVELLSLNSKYFWDKILGDIEFDLEQNSSNNSKQKISHKKSKKGK